MNKFKRLSSNSFSLMVILATLLFSGCSNNNENSDKAIKQINDFIVLQNIDKEKAGWKRNLTKPPQVEFSEGKKYFWHLRTNKGNLKIEMMPKIAPMHVSSTIYLTTIGFYDGLAFHRVISGFMAQGGDPMGNGMGGPGYKYAGEFAKEARHDKPGVLSMANAGENTDGSQFFLTFQATPHLDDRHTVFGQIVEGLDVLKIIEDLGSRSGQTKEPLKIISATISVE